MGISGYDSNIPVILQRGWEGGGKYTRLREYVCTVRAKTDKVTND